MLPLSNNNQKISVRFSQWIPRWVVKTCLQWCFLGYLLCILSGSMASTGAIGGRCLDPQMIDFSNCFQLRWVMQGILEIRWFLKKKNMSMSHVNFVDQMYIYIYPTHHHALVTFVAVFQWHFQQTSAKEPLRWKLLIVVIDCSYGPRLHNPPRWFGTPLLGNG